MGTDNTSRYKVGSVIERYSLDGLGAKLESRWVGSETESASLRELADYFNKELLRSAVAESDHQQVSGEIDHLYDRLTGDDVSRGERTRVRKRLQRDGVPIEQVEADFVTHQAIHTYLTKGRGVQKEVETGDPVTNGMETVNRLRSRLVAVSETVLSTLRDSGTITVGSVDVFAEVRVHCTDCGTHTNIQDLVADRGCDCAE